jgi:hypothetical protein
LTHGFALGFLGRAFGATALERATALDILGKPVTENPALGLAETFGIQ